MKYAFRGLGLAASLLLVSTVAMVPQARASSTPSAAAYVYIQIQGPAGSVYGFRASSTGQLSTISGSPFKPAGQIVGSNKSQFITMGQDNLHSYAVGSNGAIGAQLEENPDTDYAGGGCGNGTNGGALLDHSGQYVYVLQQNGGSGACAAYQSGTSINQVAWDSSNHLYAISESENKLYVFTVTSTSVTEDSSWSIGSPFQMIVVSE